MKRLNLNRSILIAILAIGATAASASATSRVVVTGSADIRVWVDDGRRAWDVYPSYGDITISIAAARNCYATVFVVDTDGYLHVVYPFSRRHNAWIRGGVTYRYTARELGIDALYGRGVAYVFAVGSPVPFDYSGYGDAIFVGGYGYRVYGDPYVACRRVYTTILPPRCDWGSVVISSSRFYIGTWVRYPSYLCHGHSGLHVHVTSGCDRCARVYASYHSHAATYDRSVRASDWTRDADDTVVRPAKFKSAYAQRGVTDAIDPARNMRSPGQVARDRAIVTPNSRTRVVSSDRTVREAQRTRLDVSSDASPRTKRVVTTTRSQEKTKAATRTVKTRATSSQRGGREAVVAKNKEAKRSQKSR